MGSQRVGHNWVTFTSVHWFKANKHELLRGWNHSSQNGTWTMWWDSNPAKTQLGILTHMTGTWTWPKPTVFQLRSDAWFQDLMKLRFLMSPCRKNSVRDKVIGKKQNSLERNTLQTEHQFISVAQLYPTLCDPMDCSTPGFLVQNQLPELAQPHVLRVGDTIQPSHPLSSSYPLAFNFSQNQGLFQWVSSSHLVAQVLEFQLQHQSFQWIFRTYFL